MSINRKPFIELREAVYNLLKEDGQVSSPSQKDSQPVSSPRRDQGVVKAMEFERTLVIRDGVVVKKSIPAFSPTAAKSVDAFFKAEKAEAEAHAKQWMRLYAQRQLSEAPTAVQRTSSTPAKTEEKQTVPAFTRTHSS